MNIKKMTATALLLVPALASAALPSIREGSVNVTQASGSSVVTIDYILDDGPAVVTIDVCTNGVSIGDANISHLLGDVNRLVSSGSRQITWRAWKSWEGHVVSDGSLTVKVSAWAPFAPPPYMVTDLTVPGSLRFYTSEAALPDGGLSNDIYKKDRMVFRRVPAAGVTFRMGSPVGEAGRLDREIPHLVSFTNDYYLAIFEMTQRQYALIMGSEVGSDCVARDAEDSAVRPVSGVRGPVVRGDTATYGWPTAVNPHPAGGMVGNFRSRTGLLFADLPTEAQWEFACRAGHGEAFGNGTANMDGMGWHSGNVPETLPQPVGSKAPNDWGFYDMHGNVWEWCIDWYAADASYSDGSEVTEPVGPASGSTRVVRGGNWMQPASGCRSAMRSGAPMDALPSQLPGVRLSCPVNGLFD